MADNLCGPANAAKGLAQHFDQDRSRQQDHIHAQNQPGESFRSPTSHLANAGNQHFNSFQGSPGAIPTFAAPNLGPMPMAQMHGPPNSAYMGPPPPAAMAQPNMQGDWASQFQNMSLHGPPAQAMPSTQAHLSQAHQSSPMGNTAFMHQNPMQMGPFAMPNSGYGQMGPMAPFGAFNNQAGGFMAPAGPAVDLKEQKEWRAQQMMDRQINDEEFDLALEEWMQSNQDTSQLDRGAQARTSSNPHNETELARVAQQLVDSVASDESEKFRNSSFLSLMRRIAAKEVVIQDSNLVEASTAEPSNAPAGSSIGSHATPGSSSISGSPVSENASDPKGKGKQKATEGLSP
ncbi:peroxin 20 [Apiospora kogelbergensis]|uniref:peroxin 20 n=1 Tax=Apiospora kogelbergensis TaxID=1337665 RepID=UPI0031300903